MRYYLIDELFEEDVKRIESALREQGYAGGIEGIFYLPVPEDMLTDEQREHFDKCGPYILSLETGDTWLKMELLVRARNMLRCSCLAYAAPTLRAHMIDFLDRFIRELDIPV
jgi:hypothetical protein